MTDKPTSLPLYASKKELGEMLGISPRFVQNLIADGTFRAVRLGDRLLCDVQFCVNAVQNQPAAKMTPDRRPRGRPRKQQAEG